MAIAFRTKALAKLNSPEQLDETVQTIWQMRRLAFYTFCSAIAVAVILGHLRPIAQIGTRAGNCSGGL